ncbi:hypothetical protein H2198_010347 [Neophaeococcomyces mojaviensis]|uniref:Uncharacterized protein n=1 Tax=Neophaeococcomyces mojaviensis TaxID=3383035 RepID=A0ACC2ZS23_9EURO|nr:hypothetical protein H2198_010347 [Knufia sp. JES_112]
MHLFHKKIENPLVISLDLERLARDPDAAETTFTTCDAVAFGVTLTLKDPEQIGRLIVRFYSTALANLDIAGANGTTGGSSQPWLFFHDLSRDINKTLQPGIHRWSFSSSFPELTDASLIEGDEAFDQACKVPQNDGLFQNDAHVLPPSCRIKTDHWGIDTHTRVWYAVDAEYTRPTGHQSESGKLMKPVSIDLNYKPLSSHFIPSVPKLVTIKTFQCKSKALVDGQEWDGLQMSTHEKLLSKIDVFATPKHTFQLELHVAEHYTIGKPMPVLVKLVHNPDSKSNLPDSVTRKMPMLLRKAEIEMRTWSNMRGTRKRPMTGEGVDNDGSARDMYKHTFILHDYPKTDMPRYLVPGVPLDITRLKGGENGEDGPNGERGVNYKPGEPVVWTEREDSPPNFSTYNVCTQQTMTVKLKVTFAGLDFKMEYQEDVKKDMQWWRKKKDVIELRGNCWWREHNLIEDLGESESKNKGKVVWEVPEAEDYVFQRW